MSDSQELLGGDAYWPVKLRCDAIWRYADAGTSQLEMAIRSDA